jgi:uncharacterized membrane protein
VYKSIALNPTISTSYLQNWRMKIVKSKNLIIVCVWTFVTVMLVGLFWLGDVGNVFNVGLMFFFIALIFTGAIAYSIPENLSPPTELIDELQEIKSKLNVLTSKIGKNR